MKDIAFIACYNDELLMNECRRYIERLYLPEDYRVDIITVFDAPSMCAGYNAAMKSTDAEIKIYLHQDSFIVNKYFLFNIVDIFNSDKNIGIIGITGTDGLPESAIWWDGNIKGKFPFTKELYSDERIESAASYSEAVVVDGFLIATSKDIDWREDIFDGFDFYDVSECMEYRRRNYKVVVADQKLPWCIHADGFFMNLDNYLSARDKFFKEYAEDSFSIDGVKAENKKERESFLLDYELKKEFYNAFQTKFNNTISEKVKISDYKGIFDHYIESINYLTEAGLANTLSADFLRFMIIMDAYQREEAAGKKLFLQGVTDFKELIKKFRKTEIYLRRLEYMADDNDAKEEVFDFIRNEEISDYAIEEIMNSAVAQLGNLETIKNIIGQCR
ncbi:MAG: glycosyltransferase family protein [Lachnospiraceae bacterium]|nr:glycosyltransferase family protein [Lachnospiraceae bacterium]